MLGSIGKCAHALVGGARGISKQEVLDGLPSVTELIHGSMTMSACSIFTSSMDFHLNPLLVVAAVCEALGEHPLTLTYLQAVLNADLSQAGCGEIPSTRTIGLVMQGRANAALGRVVNAAAAFEEAAATAHRYQLWLFEAYALRDLKLCVLDKMGHGEHGEHGSRRLGAVLRLLSGPVELLTPMLKGLDAAELMAMAPPEAEYKVEYEGRVASSGLHLELEGLRVMALQRRALTEGIDESHIEDAMDGNDPKQALIALLLQQCASETDGEEVKLQAARREELQGLRVMALQKKAIAEGVEPSKLEDAMDSDEPKATLIELLLTTDGAGATTESLRQDYQPHLDVAEVAPAEAAHEIPTEDVATVELQQKLRSLRLKALRQQARAEGIAESVLEEATDAEDPNEAVIAILIQKHAESLQQAAETTAHESQAATAERERELQGLGLRELRRRARELGFDDDTLEDAIDADDPKATMVALLLESSSATAGVPEGVPPAKQV